MPELLPPLEIGSFMENMWFVLLVEEEELLLAPIESREKVPIGGKELLAPVMGRLVEEF